MTNISDYVTSAVATLQHIEKLHTRARTLDALRLDAEEQLLHRIGAAYDAGQISDAELIEIYERYKLLRLVGRTQRWNEAISVTWRHMPNLWRWEPNGPAGTWVGSYPIGEKDPTPPPGSFIVYVLFDATNEPIYVGSTGDFRVRLKQHHKKQKPFVYWQAYAVEDRESAYQLEERLLRERLPRMNKRARR